MWLHYLSPPRRSDVGSNAFHLGSYLLDSEIESWVVADISPPAKRFIHYNVSSQPLTAATSSVVASPLSVGFCLFLNRRPLVISAACRSGSYMPSLDVT